MARILAKRNLVRFACLVVIALTSCDSTKRDWEAATRANTMGTYQEFRAKHPNSAFESDALGKIEALAWQVAMRMDSIPEFQRFIAEYPNSSHRVEALDRLDELAWQEALKQNTVADLEQFLVDYPKSKHSVNARAQMKKLRWDSAVAEQSVDAFYRYFIVSGADEEATRKVRAILNKRDFEVLTAQLRENFRRELKGAVTAAQVETLVTHYGGLEFALEAVQVAEQLWISRIKEDFPQDRFVARVVLTTQNVPASYFTVTEVKTTDVRPLARMALSTVPGTGITIRGGTFESEGDASSALITTDMPGDRFFLMMDFDSPFDGSKSKLPAFGHGQIYQAVNGAIAASGPGSIVRFSGSHAVSLQGISKVMGDASKFNRLTFFLLGSTGLVYLRGVGQIEFTDGKIIKLSLDAPNGLQLESNPRDSRAAASKP